MSDPPGSGPLIRPLVAGDLEAIARLHWAAARVAYAYRGWDHSLAEVRAWYSDKLSQWDWGRIVLAPEASGDSLTVGFAAATGSYLDQLFVLPSHQGSGIGGRLLSAMLLRGLRPVRLAVIRGNAPARAFYERHGFVLERTYWDDEENEMVLLYRLD